MMVLMFNQNGETDSQEMAALSCEQDMSEFLLG